MDEVFDCVPVCEHEMNELQSTELKTFSIVYKAVYELNNMLCIGCEYIRHFKCDKKKYLN